EKFEGKPGQLAYLYTDGRLGAARVIVVGLGGRRAGDAEPFRRATSAGVRRARGLGPPSGAVLIPPAGGGARERAQAVAEGAMLGTYRFDKYLREKNGKVVESVAVVEPERRFSAAARERARVGEIWASATCLARDLVNEPANVVTPTFLAERAESIA